jgi:uncharacterized protein (TIGR02246 family)
MKAAHFRILIAVVSILLLGCQNEQRTRPVPHRGTIEKEVKAQFDRLIAAVNEKDTEAWSRFYSQDAFISAIAGTDYYATRSAWVDTIAKHFSTRERQHVEPLQVRVTALTPDLALMTSEEKAEMWSKGEHAAQKHVFTMLWKKEPAGWKILHSHESYE